MPDGLSSRQIQAGRKYMPSTWLFFLKTVPQKVSHFPESLRGVLSKRTVSGVRTRVPLGFFLVTLDPL